ncbi:MAG: hypothetical protein KKF41_00495 [Actinobacteria bacterium]|nr:hypothetical protein [Actinomycetota bacterium]
MRGSGSFFLSFVLLLCMIGAATISGGCGGVAQAQAVLNDSVKTMDGVTTASMRIDTTSTINGRTFTGSMNVDEVITEEVTKLHMYGTADGTPVEMYMIGQSTYMKVMGTWYISQVPSAPGISQAGMGTIDDVSNYLSAASDPKITSEDSDSYTISYTVDNDSMLEAARRSPELAGRVERSISDMGEISGTMSVKISKSTKYVIENTGTLRCTGGPMGNGTVTATSRLLSVNSPLTIDLPSAAGDASPVSTPDLPPAGQ